MSSIPTIELKTERRSSHPWIFQKMVVKPRQRIAPGTVVEVIDRQKQWVGRGFYNGHSRIALRILSTAEDDVIDESFFAKRLQRAVSLRRDLLNLDEVTDAYRVVHSEGDGLSGLVVDRFGSLIVLEFFSAGAWRFREVIQNELTSHYPESQFYWFAEKHVQKQESFDCHPPEQPAPEIIREHGIRFRVRPGDKHKTGFFVDQRDNREMLSRFCQGRSVLDLCCNSGGFAVYAKTRGQADEVIGLDLDEQALELAKQNANLNQAKIRWVQADLFPWLRDAIANEKTFNVVILDPAKQTRDRDDVDTALRRYVDMNRLALQVVSPGGIFLTCSCTGLVSEESFLHALKRAAWQAGRVLRILKVTGAGADHPFLVHAPESRYLKAVLCEVE